MKRLLVVLVAVLALGTSAAVAQETPQGAFSSATRAVAGQPIFVRSVTPCPLIAGAYQYVRVGISPQSHPDDLEYIEATDGDLRADGSWEITISAPVDMTNGITKSYDVQAQCLRVPEPYGPAGDPVSTFRYFLRPLYVTGYGPSDVAEGDGPSGTTSTTAASTTTSAPTATTVATASFSAAAVDVPKAGLPTTTSTTADDHLTRWAEIRRELAAQGGGARLALASADSAPTRPVAPVDGGLPWWAFALATLLAVSAVVAFGVRRTSAPSELDR